MTISKTPREEAFFFSLFYGILVTQTGMLLHERESYYNENIFDDEQMRVRNLQIKSEDLPSDKPSTSLLSFSLSLSHSLSLPWCGSHSLVVFPA